MPIIPVEDLVEKAKEHIVTLEPLEAIKQFHEEGAILVDIRDIRELKHQGRVEGATHAPRGMLEFWFDPACTYHRVIFDQPEKQFILFCAAGWRSALAAKTLGEMGFTNISHIEGGFRAIKDADNTIIVEEPE